MQNAKFEEKLQAIVTPQINKKLFDHIYFETGFLNSEKQKLVFEILPDGRKIFDLSSLTKAVVTTPLVFVEIKKRNLSLDTTIAEWMGEDLPLSTETKKIKISALLRHEAGLPFWKNFFTKCSDSNRSQDLLAAIDLSIRPNLGKSVYSDLSFLLLGLCLEKKNHQKLSELFLNFKPKDLADLGTQLDPAHCISTGFNSIRGRELIGEVHDDNCAALGGFTGHAGLFASGKDLCAYLRFLWKDQREMISENAKHIVPNKQNEALMGFRQGDDFSGKAFREGLTMGHYGFTGTAFWIDPGSSAYVVLLTNRVKFAFVPTREWVEFRRNIFAVANDFSKEV